MTLTNGSFPRHRRLRWTQQFQTLLPAIAGLGFVAGGYARYLIAVGASEPEDIDVFLKRPEYFEPMQMALAGIGYRVEHESVAAISYYLPRAGLTADLKERESRKPVQLIKPLGQDTFRGRCGTVEEVLSTFDFRCNQFAIEPILVEPFTTPVVHSYVGQGSFEDADAKRLVIVNNTHPLALIYRMMKYAAKGYWMPRSEAAKLFIGWDGTSDRLKNWVHNELSREHGEFDIEMLYALTDGIIGERQLFDD